MAIFFDSLNRPIQPVEPLFLNLPSTEWFMTLVSLFRWVQNAFTNLSTLTVSNDPSSSPGWGTATFSFEQNLELEKHWKSLEQQCIRSAVEATDIEYFFFGYPDVLRFAGDVLEQVKHFFPGKPLCVRLVEEPSDGNQYAVLHVVTSDSPNVALSMLEKFDNEWWLSNCDRAFGKLIVDVEYAVE